MAIIEGDVETGLLGNFVVYVDAVGEAVVTLRAE